LRERELTAVVETLANGGDGVAFMEVSGERRAIFVRGAAPGDSLLLSVDPRARPAIGRILRVEGPGPSRVDPPCPHATRCGGCGWMHLSIEGQIDAHRRRIRETLPAVWGDVPLEVHAPTAALGYRTRARLHVRGSGGRATVGLEEVKTHEPVEVDRCIILDPRLERARVSLAPLFEGARGRGEAQIALGPEGKPVLELRWRGVLSPATFARLERAVAAGAWAGARVFEGEVSRPAVIGDPTPTTTGADGGPLLLAPGGFAQASEGGNRLLGDRLLTLARSAVSARTGKKDLGKVVELYAGGGNFTTLLARHASEIVAVESDPAACEALRENLRVRGLSRKTTRVVSGLSEGHPAGKGVDLVVLDPPRTGAKRVMHDLVEAKPRALAYVSCDVPTLARDLGVLQCAYEPWALEAFVMFPQTPHVECLAVLALRDHKAGEPR
jgi:23S rRNA (uracil1939-C5)-methyltransferase